ncbi:MAG: shikimate dehydrogenase [Rhodobacteraceae bacterium]|nr:shikimate dehydrogenase [Paracoccaceae bacterium]
MSDTKIPLAGVIGSPVAHSKSPRLFRHWLEAHGLQGHYVPMDISSENLADALKTLPKLGFVGANVTIPHKERVLALADAVTDRAALAGAANTLIFRADGTVHADNTDGVGFIENLRSGAPEWDPASGPAAIVGAGGASRAVIQALLDAGVQDIRITNRTKSRAEALRQEFGTKLTVTDWVRVGDLMDGATLLVNASSLGMVGKSEFRISIDGLAKSAVVTDLVYTPLETDLLKEAKSRGHTTVDGLGMLLYQAVPGFERWFGKRPEVTDATRQAILAE